MVRLKYLKRRKFKMRKAAVEGWQMWRRWLVLIDLYTTKGVEVFCKVDDEEVGECTK